MQPNDSLADDYLEVENPGPKSRDELELVASCKGGTIGDCQTRIKSPSSLRRLSEG